MHKNKKPDSTLTGAKMASVKLVTRKAGQRVLDNGLAINVL
jgi:hypothetical protein